MKKSLSIFICVAILSFIVTGCHERFNDYLTEPTPAVEPVYDLVSIDKYTCNAIPGTVQYFDYYTNVQIVSPLRIEGITNVVGSWKGALRVSMAHLDPDTNITTHIWNNGNKLYVGNEDNLAVLPATIHALDAVQIDAKMLGIVAGSDAGIHWIIATKALNGTWENPTLLKTIWTAPVVSIAIDKVVTEVLSGETTNIFYYIAEGNVYTALLTTLRNGNGCAYQIYNRLEHKDASGKPYKAVKVITNDGIAVYMTESKISENYNVNDLLNGNVAPEDFSTQLLLFDNRGDIKKDTGFVKIGKYNLAPFDIIFDGNNIYVPAVKYIEGSEDSKQFGIVVYANPDQNFVITNFIALPDTTTGNFYASKVVADKNVAYLRGLNQLIKVNGLLNKAEDATFEVLLDTNEVTVDMTKNMYLWNNIDGDLILSTTYVNNLSIGREDYNITKDAIAEEAPDGGKQPVKIMAVNGDYIFYLNSENNIAVQSINEDDTNEFIDVGTDTNKWLAFAIEDEIVALAVKTFLGSSAIVVAEVTEDGKPINDSGMALGLADSLRFTKSGIEMDIKDIKIISKEKSKLAGNFIVVLLAGSDGDTQLYRAALYAFDFNAKKFELVGKTVTDQGNPMDNFYSNYVVGEQTGIVDFEGDVEVIESSIDEGVMTFRGIFQTGVTTNNAWHYDFTICDNVCDIAGDLAQIDINDMSDKQLKDMLIESAAFDIQDNNISAISKYGVFTYALIGGSNLPIASQLLKAKEELVLSADITAIKNMRFVQIITEEGQHYFYSIDVSDPTDLTINETSYLKINQIVTDGENLFLTSQDAGIQLYVF